MKKCEKCGHRVVDILCVLDRSGSMSNIIDETVGAFNEFVEQQKKVAGEARLTLVSFDNEYSIVMDKVNIKEVKPLTVADVKPRGMTALNDAIGKAINTMDSDDVICLIQTDGHENASKEYTHTQIKDLITSKKNVGWDISFIGAGVDAFSMGSTYGFTADKCLSVDKTKDGMDTYRNFSSTVATSFRS